jgi:MFS transporter, FSR family, fosmidomycin resistance protein
MNPKMLILLALTHLATDTCQGALPALLPHLKESMGLTYAAAGGIVMAMTLTSSVIQPIFGYLTDRWRLTWLVPSGVVIAGLGFAVLGLVDGYGLVLASVMLSGLGVASFHPEAFKRVLSSAGERKVTAVSFFMVGGNMGMALGPIIITSCVAWLGNPGTILFSLPLWVMGTLVLLNWGNLVRAGAGKSSTADQTPPRPLGNRLKPLSILLIAVTLRSWAHFGITAYLPFFYVDHLGGDPLLVGHLLSVFLFCGVAGTLLGGPIADRVGPRSFFITSVTVVTPLMVSFLFVGPVWLFILTGLAGAFLMSTWSTVMVMAQQILPDRAGMASGLMVGFAMGSGGIGATLFGLVADQWGLTLVVAIASALPVLSAVAAWFIPKPQAAPAV